MWSEDAQGHPLRQQLTPKAPEQVSLFDKLGVRLRCPDILDLSIIWHSANHWCVRNMASDAVEQLVEEREGEGAGELLWQRSAAQRSIALALFNGTERKRAGSLCFKININIIM